MKKSAIIAGIFLFVVAFCFANLALQNGYDLFQKALAKERAEGNLEEAIALYQRVIEESKDESLAAKAQLRIGICYEKLGRIEAQKAYEMVLKNYANQKETAEEARRRLADLMKPQAEEESGGLSVQRVWSGPEVMTWGSLSPNGRYLSFVESLDLYIRDLKTGKNRRLTRDGSLEKRVLAQYSVFSPDGSRIVYSWRNEDWIWDLRMIDIEDSELRILLRRESGDEIMPLGWSPDGERILTAFFSRDPQNIRNEMGFVSVKKGSLEIIESAHRPSSYLSFSGTRLSPDGRYIACDAPADEKTEHRDIFLRSLDSSHEFPLIRHPADDHSPLWTPDGRHILFISDREGEPGVWMIDVEEGKGESKAKLVKSDIGKFARWMGITAEGACYYGVKTYRSDIYTADFDRLASNILRKPKVLYGRFEGSNSDPAWSSDGNYLAYFRHDWEDRNNPGASTIIIRSMKTGEERELSNILNQPEDIRWFPDGKSLLVSDFRSPKDRDYSIDFHRVDVETGKTDILLRSEEKIGTMRPGISPDGKTIFFFCEKQPDETVLISYNVESHERKEIYLPGHQMTMRIPISLSPDGRRLAFVEDNGAWPAIFTVKVMGVDGENPKDLLSAQWPEIINAQRVLTWTADGTHLMTLRMTFDSDEVQPRSHTFLYNDELLLIPVEGGSIQAEKLASREISSMSIHPDGSKVAFMAMSENPPYEIWALENFLPKR